MWGNAWVGGLIGVAVALAGCQMQGPLTLFRRCVVNAQSAAAIQTGDITGECDLGAAVVLVAVPSEGASAEDLVAAGAPSGSIEMLSDSELDGARWCVYRPHGGGAQTEQRAEGQTVPGELECVESPVRVDRVMLTDSSRVTFRLRVDSPGVSLVQLAASSSE